MPSLLWGKKKQILSLPNDTAPDWMNSHAQNPYALIFDDRVRVYFNCRSKPDGNGIISFPGYVDLDKENLIKINSISKKPVMNLGDIGEFDEFGCMSSCLINNNDELWMYYVGWTRCVSVPYNWSIGLAVSYDQGVSFKKKFQGPVIGAEKTEPFLQNGCFVEKIDNKNWHMWYSTGQRWLRGHDKFESQYTIVHADSSDGINWIRNGKNIIPLKFEDETQTTPTIFFLDDKYHMLFSYRHSIDFRNASRGYRIGYAWSDDLVVWNRDDSRVGLDISESGWDSEMICYPHVFEIDNKVYMLYCGNGFGIEGFGLAELIK